MKTLCIAGKNNIAVDILDFVSENFNLAIKVVLNKTDNGKNNFQKSLKLAAEKKKIEIVNLEDLYTIENLFFISLEFDRLIIPEKFSSKNLFNIHFSLLPEFKGMYTSALPILLGKKYSGVTLHEIDAGIDTGDIIDQRRIEILPNYTSRDLYLKYIQVGTELVKINLPDLLNMNYKKYQQPYENSTYFSKKSLNFQNLEVDFNSTAYQVVNQLRAFSFREYQLPKLFDKRIYKWEVLSEKSNKNKKLIEFECENYAIINTIDFKVKLFFDFYEQLWESCKRNDTNSIKKYLNYIDDINLRSNEGLNALMYSVANGCLEAVELLVSHGADINTLDYDGKSVLDYAEENSQKNNGERILSFLKLIKK